MQRGEAEQEKRKKRVEEKWGDEIKAELRVGAREGGRGGRRQVVGARSESERKNEGGQTSLMRKCQMNKGSRRGLYQREVQTA